MESAKQVMPRESIVESISKRETYLSNNPLWLCYQVATPTTVQLTPTEVRTLLGNNNIFADMGDVDELVYFKTGSEAVARLIEAYMRGAQ